MGVWSQDNIEEWIVNFVLDKSRRKKVKLLVLRLVIWNVRIMCFGFFDDFQQIDDVRKIVVISCEFKRFNIDIVVLQEIRFLLNGSLKEEDYIFFWQGKVQEEYCVYGVGFVVRNFLLVLVELFFEGIVCIFFFCFIIILGFVNIMSVYVFMFCFIVEVKDEFYSQFEIVIKEVFFLEYLYLFGDFNVWIGLDYIFWF